MLIPASRRAQCTMWLVAQVRSVVPALLLSRALHSCLGEYHIGILLCLGFFGVVSMSTEVGVVPIGFTSLTQDPCLMRLRHKQVKTESFRQGVDIHLRRTLCTVTAICSPTLLSATHRMDLLSICGRLTAHQRALGN